MPRRYLNDDEDLLVQLRPHWVFFSGPLFVTVLAVAVVITIIVRRTVYPQLAGRRIVGSGCDPRGVAPRTPRSMAAVHVRTDHDPDFGAPQRVRS